MPLGRSAVLVGHSFERSQTCDAILCVQCLAPDEIPVHNGLILGGAHRYVYCASEDFVFAVDEHGGVGGKKELFSSKT